MALVTTVGNRTISSDVALADATSLTLYQGLFGQVTTINATPTAGGTGYSTNDILTITNARAISKATVKVITQAAGVVTVLQTTPTVAGDAYIVGTGQATTGGSGGNDCTVNITAITQTARNYQFNIGTITFAPKATGAGVISGKLQLIDNGNIVYEIACPFVVGATAAGQPSPIVVPLNFTWTPAGAVTVKYVAVTNASTASVSVDWQLVSQ